LNIILRAGLALTAVFFGSAAIADPPAPAPGPPPLAAYGRLPAIEDIELSPDGSLFAVVVTDGDSRNVLVKQVADGKLISALKAGDQKLRAIQWAGNDHLLLTSSVTTVIMAVQGSRQEWWMSSDFNVRTGKQRPLLDRAQNGDTLNVVAGLPEARIIDGKPYAIVQGVLFIDHQGAISLFKVDLETGAATLFRPGDDRTRDWVLDADGDALARSDYADDTGRWTLHVKRAGVWVTVKTLTDRTGGPSLLGLGRDGHSLLLAESGDKDDALFELAPDASDWDHPLATGAVTGVFDPATHALMGLVKLEGEASSYQFFAAADQAMWRSVMRAYGGQGRVSLASLSADHRKVVVLVDSPTEGPAFALIDMATHKGVWLGSTYEAASARVNPVVPVAFKAADGTPLSGYLTLPNGRPVKDLPLVVFPHGGPAARDTADFDWWAQAMASRGYAVLQVNFRGSEGFGWSFLSAGFGQWGRKMQTDLSDGVRFLAADGRIDAKRVCIVGASYGGYAALAGATLDPGVYRCAASIAGPSDLSRMVSWSGEEHGVTSKRYWLRFMGAERMGDPRLREISPAAHADRVVAPILLVHGRDDTVVPFTQTQMMADALKRAGKPYDLVVLRHEDHWLSHGDTRLQMLEAVIAFLEKNNPPG
jgi:dipeptidyl aminopeptidase/acylaminoacyl peptidase